MREYTTDDEIREFAANLCSLCALHKADWGIPEGDLSTLRSLAEDYEVKLAAARSPDRRKSDTVAKNEAKKALKAYLPVFQGKVLDYNKAVTPEARRSLGLRVRKTGKTPILRPDRAPLAYLEIRGPGRLALHYKPEGAKGSGKPYGIAGVLIRHGVFGRDDPPPANSEGLPKALIGTSTPELIEYPPEERGKQARFTLAWFNEKGELGPETEQIVEAVP